MKPILEIKNVGKQYKIGGDSVPYQNLRDSLAGIFRRRQRAEGDGTFWALDDISFDVEVGESIGIIGRNGAGKSTLLKILSRITPPTRGSITARGRVASLLEVGTGFHPELTGRENIYLNGSILGLTRVEIDKKYDEIIDFSGVERFLETPLKHYSSGMQLRLAFAVAAHLEPEILVIDEVLAVGDAAFQKKCLGKMGEVSRSGRTIIFVSHDMQAISTLTRRCVVLNKGNIGYLGDTPTGISTYLSYNRAGDAVYEANPSADVPKLTRVEVKTSMPNQVHGFGKPLHIEFEIQTPRPLESSSLAFQIMDSMERPIIHLWTYDSQRPMCREAGTHRITCEIPFSRLYMGQYSLKVYFTEAAGQEKLEIIEGICPFKVEMLEVYREFRWWPNTCTYLEDGNWQFHQRVLSEQ